MSHNTFGHLFRVTTWGESHGPALGCVVDGCPPGIALTAEMIQGFLDKRRPGNGKFVTQLGLVTDASRHHRTSWTASQTTFRWPAPAREAYLEHENAKTELKSLMPEDAKEAIGHGIRAKRSKSGAVSFDVLSMERSHAAL